MEDGTFTLLDARWIAPGSNPPEEEPKANGTVPGWLAVLSPTETSGSCSVEGRKADIIPGASMEHIWASIDIGSTKCVHNMGITLKKNSCFNLILFCTVMLGLDSQTILPSEATMTIFTLLLRERCKFQSREHILFDWILMTGHAFSSMEKRYASSANRRINAWLTYIDTRRTGA